MLILLLILLAVGAGLVALLWTGTLLAQGYFYDSPTDKLEWRAPAAGGALALFLTIWCLIEYSSPNSTGPLHEFTTQQVTEVTKFVSVRRSETGEEKEIPFESRTIGPNRFDFVDANASPWARAKSGSMVAIIVEEKSGDDVKRTRFNAEMKDGKFAERESRGVKQSLRYVEENGDRYMEEDRIGKIISYRKG